MMMSLETHSTLFLKTEGELIGLLASAKVQILKGIGKGIANSVVVNNVRKLVPIMPGMA
jgi:hypothetical protein